MSDPIEMTQEEFDETKEGLEGLLKDPDLKGMDKLMIKMAKDDLQFVKIVEKSSVPKTEKE